MNKQEKDIIVNKLAEKLNGSSFIYLTDTSRLSANDTNRLRRDFFKVGVEMSVVKNTLVKRAMEQSEKDFSAMYEALVGNTAVLLSDNVKAPAKAIKNFRKKTDKPLLKAAYIDSDVFIGDNNLDALIEFKSKEDLVGEIVGLLQSPAKNVLSALLSGKSTIGGLIKTLQEKNN